MAHPVLGELEYLENIQAPHRKVPGGQQLKTHTLLAVRWLCHPEEPSCVIRSLRMGMNKLKPLTTRGIYSVVKLELLLVKGSPAFALRAWGVELRPVTITWWKCNSWHNGNNNNNNNDVVIAFYSTFCRSAFISKRHFYSHSNYLLKAMFMFELL